VSEFKQPQAVVTRHSPPRTRAVRCGETVDQYGGNLRGAGLNQAETWPLATGLHQTFARVADATSAEEDQRQLERVRRGVVCPRCAGCRRCVAAQL